MNDYFELFHPTRGNVPNHIGLIPDGSRRWAKSRGISYFESYEIAMAKLSQILDFLYGKGVGTVSIYFSSSQNFDRPKEEIEAFCKAESNFCSHYILPSVQKNKIKWITVAMLNLSLDICLIPWRNLSQRLWK